MQELLHGALAGFAATAPMTVAMEGLHRCLLREERYPLRQREVAESLAEGARVNHRLDETQQQRLVLLAHFGYGAAVGAVYAALTRGTRLPGPATGAAFGLAV